MGIAIPGQNLQTGLAVEFPDASKRYNMPGWRGPGLFGRREYHLNSKMSETELSWHIEPVGDDVLVGSDRLITKR
ncbi:MAG TPA: hypothetical protein VM553_18070 [Dongiaceae bacterium]|nr:hypothetical protein [Dongiaceae bacterium]